eukprot:364809-Chlamydomonas_euryale.AAC.25
MPLRGGGAEKKRACGGARRSGVHDLLLMKLSELLLKLATHPARPQLSTPWPLRAVSAVRATAARCV